MSRSRVNNNLESFIKSQLRLIEIEYSAEIKPTNESQKNLKLVKVERQGDSIHNLRCVSICPGLFRYLMVSLGHNLSDHPLPSHKITVGDNVSLRERPDSESLASGVVYSLNSNQITVAFERDRNLSLDQEFANFCLIKSSNDVTYKRLKKALINLRNYSMRGRARRLIDLLFGKRSPGRPVDIGSIEFVNKQLDYSQKEAITFALRSKELCIIHGPPGTGKTTSIVEVILQLAKQGLKILVCAPSNVAIDNLVERLSAYKVQNMIRLGHPARASKDLHKFTLAAAIARSDENSIIEGIRQKIDGIRGPRDRNKRAQIKHLRKDVKRLESKIIKKVLISSDIVLSTLISASSDGPLKHIVYDSRHQLDVLIIDECSQALETACWIPLTFVDKCILAGDHFQLPPTIVSATAAKEGLELTLMERLLSNFDHELVVRMLTVQYRMHQDIMEWSSKRFYKNKLVAHESVQNQSMSKISNLQDCPPLLLIDTAGCDMSELDVEYDESKGNESEADIAAYYVLHLIKAGVKPENIGIITPYALQVELIRLRLNGKYPTIEIRSVDGFQGSEKEVIILSLVRSNVKKKTGFLSEYRRMNVAVTRAKKHLVVICDSDTVSAEPHISSLITYLNDRGKVKSAREYLSSIKIFKDIKRPPHLRLKKLKRDKKTTKKTSERKANNNKKNTSSPDNQKPEKKPIVSQDSRSKADEAIIRKIRQKLVEFQSSSEVKLAFPPTLSSFKRRIVHEIAEELQLKHFTVTREGDKRTILVMKLVPKNSPTKSLIAERSDQENPQQIDEICLSTEVDTKVDQSSNNLDEQQSKKISNEPANPNKSTEQKTVEEQPVAKHVTNVQEKPPPVDSTKNFDLNSKLDKLKEDFDKMLDLVKKMDSVCLES